MALGANAADVVWLVLRQSLGTIFGGVGVGIAVASAAGRLLERLVAGMQPSLRSPRPSLLYYGFHTGGGGSRVLCLPAAPAAPTR
jgi:hypothetical protein